MSTKEVDLKDFAKELGVDTKAEIEHFKKSILDGLYASLPMLVENSPVDTGLYAQSWGVSKLEDGAEIGNTAPYAPIIENGARPFTPPIGPLLAWAKRVLQDPSQPPDYSHQVWALAKSVQKKISERGMFPRHILENATSGILDNIKAAYERTGTEHKE